MNLNRNSLVIKSNKFNKRLNLFFIRLNLKIIITSINKYKILFLKNNFEILYKM